MSGLVTRSKKKAVPQRPHSPDSELDPAMGKNTNVAKRARKAKEADLDTLEDAEIVEKPQQSGSGLNQQVDVNALHLLVMGAVKTGVKEAVALLKELEEEFKIQDFSVPLFTALLEIVKAAAMEETEEGRKEIFKKAVSLCKAVDKSRMPPVEGLCAGWDILKDDPGFAADSNKLAKKIKTDLKEDLPHLFVAPGVAAAAGVTTGSGLAAPMSSGYMMGGAGGMAGYKAGGKGGAPCYLCNAREHKVDSCHRNTARWDYTYIKYLMTKCGWNADQVVAKMHRDPLRQEPV